MYKVIIVDDEALIRKGLISLVNWIELGCDVVYEAVNGADAINYLESNPVDIVVSDIKMPEMDGISLSKYIYENHPPIKVIILSAYADFSYAQSAIEYNVVDFVIKTSYAHKIPEAIHKAIHLISAENNNNSKLKLLEDALEENLIEIREKFIKDVLNGIIVDNENILRRLKDFEVQLQHYYLLTYEINPIAQTNINLSIEEHNRFLMSVKNFLSLALKDYDNLTIIMSKNTLISIVSFSIKDSPNSTHLLLMICNEIVSMVEGFMNFKVRIGISRMHHSPKELLESYDESQKAFSSIFYNDNTVSVYSNHLYNQFESNTVPLQEYVDEVVNHVKTGSGQKAISVLMKLFEEYIKIKETVEQVKISSILLCSACYKLLTDYSPYMDNDIKSERVVYKEIEDCKSLKELTNILSSLIEAVSCIISSHSKQRNYLVHKVCNYISQNYNKEINLQSIADHIHINSSYLSSLYKRETGESLIEALNKYRVEMAKKLLRDPTKKIFEVGIAVGIEDPAYFTQVFTKYAGMSPKAFRIQL